jgi:hypothetical protein
MTVILRTALQLPCSIRLFDQRRLAKLRDQFLATHQSFLRYFKFHAAKPNKGVGQILSKHVAFAKKVRGRIR